MAVAPPVITHSHYSHYDVLVLTATSNQQTISYCVRNQPNQKPWNAALIAPNQIAGKPT
jgi:L-ascorbate metabolism protein UlaG (beta-lactamase superfamily)